MLITKPAGHDHCAHVFAWHDTLTDAEIDARYPEVDDQPEVEEGDAHEPEECDTCRGTGEGMFDGLACMWCKGKGYRVQQYREAA